MAAKELILYTEVLQKLKDKIKSSQQKAILAVNNELLGVYWEIGKAIAEQEELAGWGGKIIDKLAADLKAEFPEMKGLSPRNLRYMRDFALAWPEILQQPAAKLQNIENEHIKIWQQLAAKLPWGHHQVLLVKLKTTEERTFYIKKAVENGWSRSVLEHQIESGLHKAQGTLINNFTNTLPAYQSELTQQVFKDPYNFDFIFLGEQAREKDLEDALLTQVTKVLLELGVGFAFMGRQKRFEAGGREFFVDLLFYHTKLRRHIIIELKIGEFEPEFVSKMNLYLGLADDQLRGEYDEPAVGLILCKTNNKIVAEYALRDTSKPIGIAEYKIAERLPESILGELPSIEEIEQWIDEEMEEAQNSVDERFNVIKDKLKSLQKEDIHTPVTFEILNKLYKESLRILYDQIKQKVSEFEDHFLRLDLKWFGPGYVLLNQDQADSFWQNEMQTKKTTEFNFQVKLEGFKKLQANQLNSENTIMLQLDEYHYKISLIRHNNQNLLLKKPFHQMLTLQDRQEITDIFVTAILDDIEIFLKEFDN